jgi:hypothetical protein
MRAFDQGISKMALQILFLATGSVKNPIIMLET